MINNILKKLVSIIITILIMFFAHTAFAQNVDHFSVVPSSNSVIIGQDVTLTITAYDSSNNVILDYNGSPILSGLDVSPNNTTPHYGPMNFVNGVSNTIIRSFSNQPNQSITINDSNIVGNSGTINFSAGPLNSISIPFVDKSLSAGQSVQFNTICYDAYLNERSGDLITWANTNSSGLFESTLAESYQVKANSGTINSNVVNVSVSHANIVDHLTISPTDIHLSSTDQSQNYTVTAFDQYQNSWDATNQATFTTTDPKGSFILSSYYAGKVGSWTVQASYGEKSITTGIIIDFPGKADKIEFVNLPDVINTNDIIQFYTKVFDKDGNELSSPTTVWTITEGINNSVIDTNGRFLSNLAGTYKIKNQFENASTILTISIADKIILASSATVSIVPVQETIAKIEKSDKNVIEQNVKPAEITKTDVINNSSENLIDTTTEENSINTIADDNEQSTLSDETGQIKSAETEANINNNSKFVLILTLIVAAVILGFAYWGYSVWGTENTVAKVNSNETISLSNDKIESTEKINNLEKNDKDEDSRW
jgi:hypothetical protein